MQKSARVIQVPSSRGLISVRFETERTGATMDRMIRLYVEGTEVGNKHVAYDLPAGVHHASVSTWRKYQDARQGNLVVRSGFGLCGCYDSYDQSAPLNPRHPESDTEHACGCIEIMKCLGWYYPMLLAPGYFGRAETLLKYHDTGENFYGDHPDDGSQNRDEKDFTELMELAATVADLPITEQRQLIEDFVHFQSPLFPNYPQNEAEMVQLARAVDKLETILSAAAYEKAGAGGTLVYKEQHSGGITGQDRYFIDEIGDSSILASWLAHTVRDYHMYYGFPYVLDIVRAAVIDVRGEWFPWFDRFCESHQIPLENVVHPFL